MMPLSIPIWRAVRDDASGAAEGSLYPSLLQEKWESLDEILRDFHSRSGPAQARGLLTVRRGRGVMAHLVGSALRLPPAGDSVPTLLVVEPEMPSRSGRLEQTWTRTFGTRTLASRQFALHGGLLAERFRFIELRFRLNVEAGALRFEQTGAALALGLLRIGISRRLWPRIEACVRAAVPHADAMAVRVTFSMPIIGMVLRYAGCVRPEAAPP